MTSAYHPEKWNVTKNLFIWQFALGGKELPGWVLAEAKANQHFKEYPILEYYWRHQEKNAMVKIDVIPTASWKEAQAGFRGLLQEHMILQLPAVPDKMALLGDVAYTGPSDEMRNMLFIRANMIVMLNSIGRETVRTEQLAFDVDNLFTRKQHAGNGKTRPEILQFEAELREMPAGRATVLNLRAEDPVQRPLWYRFTTDNGEILQENDRVVYLAEKPGEGKVTVLAVNPEGDTDEKSIPVKVL
ncbi:hypothetical protein ACFOTA_16365 [Chitinophaga sp. GCM10012297]|uniref:Ig-like domain-containing protein n=1 Tax=Chitinophaga chungangae TaxID=2821488 RepID=A0ABS3YGJ0_9BACT|nr:hypothetical protein [Chitinophaga chungangae]MBO9153795.1 hypothetical protein [Chitinophaga chungangae]